MFNKSDIVENGLILSWIGVSLSDIQNVLSIILLVLDLVWILIKVLRKIIPKIREYLKDGKLDQDEIKDLSNNIKDEIENIKKDGDQV